MKTPEEIKKGLEMCSRENTSILRSCLSCPYYNFKHCIREKCNDVLTYVEQLEAENKRLQDRIDLMLIQMRGDCGCCKHRDKYGMYDSCICDTCFLKADRPDWEYEGLPGDDAHETR